MNTHAKETHASLTPKPLRQSNMELLRIVSMLLVVVVHTGFFALGRPSVTDIVSECGASFARNLTQAFATGCVDLFVLLTGYFGIKRPSVRGLANLLFQAAFYTIGIFAVLCAAGIVPFGKEEVLHALMITRGYWFINSYVCLYLLTPWLNRLVERMSRRDLGRLLIGFFALQTAVVWGLNIGNFFIGGYSLTSFMSLYLVMRYIRIHGGRWTARSRWADLGIVVAVPFVIAGLELANTWQGWNFFGNDIKFHPDLYSYINPLVLLAAVHLVLFMSKIRFTSRAVNHLAASSLAVYLLHLNPLVVNYFKTAVRTIHTLPTWQIPFATAALILAIFAAAYVLDQLRLALWRTLTRHLPLLQK